MTALTANRDDLIQDGAIYVFPVAASTTIYAGSAVCLNSSGYLVPAADTSGNVYAGEAISFINNSAGSAGAMTCACRLSGVAQFVFAGTATQATVGAKVYVSDSQSVNTTTTNSVLVGRVVEFDSANSVRVKFAALNS
jgi:predicted RecA/RadA family phage recombinase